MNESIADDIIIEGTGSFTPPPSPCGNEKCYYILRFNPDGSEKGWELEHEPSCTWEE